MNADGTVSDAPVPVPAADGAGSAAAATPGPVSTAPATTGGAAGAGAAEDEVLPDLAPLVTERKRTFSVGLDPDVEQTAAEWFESLGYRTLNGDTHYTKARRRRTTTTFHPYDTTA